MRDRPRTPKAIETAVLIAARRRCCLCVYLQHHDEVRKGQIAHLNRNRKDFRLDNLVWLCFDHHDEYDGRTSQSKGLTRREVKAYRDRLYAKYGHIQGVSSHGTKVHALNRAESDYEHVRQRFPAEVGFPSEHWRFPLWQVANQPELFAYKAGNGADGVCLIERVDLPDGRIVMAAIAVAGNPGNSITNCVEELCFQVCERFGIPANRLVWLEHYDYYDNEWDQVIFSQVPPKGPFAGPKWVPMTLALWKDLLLRPKKRLVNRSRNYASKLIKRFSWPSDAILDHE